MRNKLKIIKNSFIVFLTIILMFSLFSCKKMPDNDPDQSENDETQEDDTNNTEYYQLIENYEIAVVFDNSGSMYIGNNAMAWSRAKYAVEIFASMLNYNQRGTVPGDLLKVFPMWEVTTDGSTPSYESGAGSSEPIIVSSIRDIDKIHNMFTLRAWGTPYETVTKAYKELQKSTAPQRWLIVLTDGEFEGVSTDQLGKNLSSLANEDIKIQYLGLGEASDLNKYATENFYSKKASSSQSLKSDIIDICNRIFQRDQLPATALKSKNLTLDISMNNLIVFAQGKNASIKGMKDSEGKDIEIISDSGQRTFSTLNAGNYRSAPADQTLAGHVVTFGSCPAGTYTINYEDAESIQFFYTPNIDIMLKFADAEGNVIDISGHKEKLYPGNYKLNYYLIDAITKNDVTTSPLIAPVEFLGGYERSDGVAEDIENGGQVKLEPDTATFLKVDASYLKNYQLTTRNRIDDYTVEISYPKIDVSLNTLQEKNWFTTRDFDNWEPIVANLTIDGKPLSDAQLENAQLDIDLGKNIEFPYRIEKCNGESKIKIYLGQDKNGEKTDTPQGKYNMNVQSRYVYGEGGQDIIGKSDSVKFRVRFYPWWTKYAVAGLGALLLVIVYNIYLQKKGFPTDMWMVETENGREKKPLLIKFEEHGTKLFPRSRAITVDAKPKSSLRNAKKKGALVEISNIKVSPNVSFLEIRGTEYTNTGSGIKIPPEKTYDIRSGTKINYTQDGVSHQGVLKCPKPKKK